MRARRRQAWKEDEPSRPTKSLDRPAEAHQVLVTLQQIVRGATDPGTSYLDQQVRVLALLGRHEEAFAVIVRMGRRPVYRYDPAFDALRNHPPFQAWIERPDPLR